MANYYTLGAELPVLVQHDYRAHQLSSAEFLDKFRAQATKGDWKQVKLLLLRGDNSVLLQLLRGVEDPYVPEGAYLILGVEKLKQLIVATEAQQEAERRAYEINEQLGFKMERTNIRLKVPKNTYPRYMIDFVYRYLDDQYNGIESRYFYEDILLIQYAKYVQKHGNAFLRRWFALEQDITATLAAFTADKYGLDRELYILGDKDLYELLRKGDWREITFSEEAELVSKMRHISEEEHLAVREQRIDDFKWELLDRVTFADVFSINAMLVYLLKLQILERWEKLDKVQGEAQFRHIVSMLNEEFSNELNEFKKSVKLKNRERKIVRKDEGE